MSFKYRLRIFFFLLTVLPLLVAGWAIQEFFKENQAGRVDAELASVLTSARTVFGQRRDMAAQAVQELTNDTSVQEAMRDGDRGRLRTAIAPYLDEPVAVAILDREGTVLAGGLPEDPAFRTQTEVSSAAGATFGSVTAGVGLSPQSAGTLDREVPGVLHVGYRVGDEVIRAEGREPLALDAEALPPAFDARVGDAGFRVAEFELQGTTQPASLVALYPEERIAAQISSVRAKVAVGVAVMLLVILVGAEIVVRSITSQLGAFAQRAREVGEGRFAGEIAVHGNDEIAQFAQAFNRMSVELEHRIDELESERRRVREALARFGRALEATHDVSALLGIVVESGMGAVGARGGRLLIVDEQTGRLIEHLRIGSARGADSSVLPAEAVYGEGVEGQALQTMRPALGPEPATVLAVPLQSSQTVIGLLTLIDPERGAFDHSDGDTLLALASQGAVAIDNARMHRLITKQAATDGLTGLANHREFQDQLRREMERAQRFALPVALVLLDLDDFKVVNDRYGHLAGDTVLRGVAATLRLLVREIDCAARYGGEEFAIILPGTTAEGAARLAERIRLAIGERPVVAEGRNVGVTASFGVGAIPEDGTTQVELIAAADTALYRAKHGGKNRVAVSGGVREAGVPAGRPPY